MVHPAASRYATNASARAGSAAAARDREKRSAYTSADPTGYHFVPFSVESYGHLGRPALEFLNAVTETACNDSDGLDLQKSCFAESIYRDVSVALCRGLAHLYKKSAQLMIPVSGTHHQCGLSTPTADVSAV